MATHHQPIAANSPWMSVDHQWIQMDTRNWQWQLTCLPFIGALKEIRDKIWFFSGGLRFHLLHRFMNGKGKQLRRNIMIHGGLVIFKFHFPRNRQVFILMILGLMEITGKPYNPSVWFRWCPQGVSPPNNTYEFSKNVYITSKRLQKTLKRIPQIALPPLPPPAPATPIPTPELPVRLNFVVNPFGFVQNPLNHEWTMY